jgi:hypothetical protein
MSTNFQNSINAGLGVAAGAAVASGKTAVRKEEKAIKGMQESLSAEMESSAKDLKAAADVPSKKAIPNKQEREALQKGIEANQRLAAISKDISASRERQYQKMPSAESYGKLQQARKAQQDYERLADRDIQRLKEANKRAEQRREARKAQRTTIKDIMNTPIDGGTIADLGPEAQKIAIQALRGDRNGSKKK